MLCEVGVNVIQCSLTQRQKSYLLFFCASNLLLLDQMRRLHCVLEPVALRWFDREVGLSLWRSSCLPEVSLRLT